MGAYLWMSMSSLQNVQKGCPFIALRISIGRPVLILDQIKACQEESGQQSAEGKLYDSA
jgi:hypothetical protein